MSAVEKIQNARSGFNGLPGVAKTAIVVGGVILVFYGIKEFKKIIDRQEELKAIKDIQKEGVDLVNSGVKATYKNSQYSNWANALEDAINGCGTDFDSIQDILTSMKNDVDVRKLWDSYGVRTNSCGFWYEAEQNLSSALRSEVNISDIKDFNNTFKKKGITFKI